MNRRYTITISAAAVIASNHLVALMGQVERLAASVDATTDAKTDLVLEWDELAVVVPIETPIEKQSAESINGAAGDLSTAAAAVLSVCSLRRNGARMRVVSPCSSGLSLASLRASLSMRSSADAGARRPARRAADTAAAASARTATTSGSWTRWSRSRRTP